MKALLIFILSAISLSASASSSRIADETLEMDEMVRFIGNACNLDTSDLKTWKVVQRSPAFFWYSSHIALKGEPSPARKTIIRGAINCNHAAGPMVNEAKVADSYAKISN